VVRWIGSPSSENPAPVTEIRTGTPLQNAGGEGASGSDATPVASPDEASSSADGTDWLARGLALAALVAALALLVSKRKERS
jgi:hypothetical protein